MTNREHAIETSRKFEFYLLALVFTVLGLSIQTGALKSHNYQFIFEISSWTAFLISGLAGLSRMEWIPHLYNQTADQEYDAQLVKTLQASPTVLSSDTLKPFSRSEVLAGIENVQNRIGLRKAELSRLDRVNKYKYEVHRWAFAAGLILLVISRILKGID